MSRAGSASGAASAAQPSGPILLRVYCPSPSQSARRPRRCDEAARARAPSGPRPQFQSRRSSSRAHPLARREGRGAGVVEVGVDEPYERQRTHRGREHRQERRRALGEALGVAQRDGFEPLQARRREHARGLRGGPGFLKIEPPQGVEEGQRGEGLEGLGALGPLEVDGPQRRLSGELRRVRHDARGRGVAARDEAPPEAPRVGDRGEGTEPRSGVRLQCRGEGRPRGGARVVIGKPRVGALIANERGAVFVSERRERVGDGEPRRVVVGRGDHPREEGVERFGEHVGDVSAAAASPMATQRALAAACAWAQRPPPSRPARPWGVATSPPLRHPSPPPFRHPGTFSLVISRPEFLARRALCSLACRAPRTSGWSPC